MSSYIQVLGHWIDRLTQWLDEAQGKTPPQIPVDEQKQWRNQLEQFQTQLSRPNISIAMLGPSQQGKSTLINAILGENILATGGSAGACTSAITSLHYKDQSAFTVEIQLISLSEWRHEIESAIEHFQLTAITTNLDEQESIDKEAVEEVTAAKDRLSAIYGCEITLPFLENIINQEMLGLDKALFEWLQDHARTIKLNSEKPNELRAKLKPYLTGKSQNGSSVYWPMVQEVKLYGKFKALEDGLSLVDLPGLDDPNEAREEITRKYLLGARHIWLVCRAKNALTKTIVKLMRDDKMLLRLFNEGRLPTFTVVATHIDDVPVDNVLEEMGHSVEARDEGLVTDFEIANHYTASVINAIRSQLEQSANNIVAGAQDLNTKPDQINNFLSSVSRIPIFPVATKYYLKLKEKERNYKSQIELTETQTNMPHLLDHLHRLTQADGYNAQANAIAIQTKRVQQDIRFFFEKRLNGYQTQTLQREKDWQKLNKLAAESYRDISNKVDTENEVASKLFSSHMQSFEVSLARNRIQAVKSVRGKVNDWGDIHWSTLKAIVARDGVYYSRSSGKRYDLNTSISDILMEKIAFDWDTFFSTHLEKIIQDLTRELNRLLEKYGDSLISQLKLLEQDAQLVDLLQNNLATAHVSFRAQSDIAIADLKTIILNTRVMLTASVSETIKRNMLVAYEKAKQESGRGMRQRVLEILALFASENAQTIFVNTEQDLRDGVRELNRTLGRQLEKLCNDAKKKLTLMLDNVTVTPLDTADLATAISEAEQALAALNNLTPSEITFV